MWADAQVFNVTSILTNVAAIAALQTLRSVGANMTEMQRQVSSGLRVQVAADNAAYWSISTTMRSDNMAISAVSDALGLGAAKLDTAYTGTEAVIEVLDEFKAKLVAAREPGVDKAKIQKELDQLNAQAASIVASSSFNSVNWLKTESAFHLQDVTLLPERLTSGFVRNTDNTVSVKTVDIDLRRTSMFNTGGGGILQKDIADYYMPLSEMSSYTFYHEGHEQYLFSGPVTFGALDVSTFDLVVDRSSLSAGDTFSIVIDKTVVDDALGTTDGIINSVAEVRLVLQKAFDNAGASPYANPYGHYAPANGYSIQSLETTAHVGSSIFIENLSDPGGKLGFASPSGSDHDNMNTSSSMNFIQPFKVMLDATISFNLSIDGNPETNFTIDRTAVDAALGTIDGMINSANDLKTVIDYVTSGMGLAVTVNGNQMVFSPDQAVYPGYGNKAAAFYISKFFPNPPFTLRFDLAEIDITTTAFTIDEYIEGVEHMLTEAIDSASTLGALRSRIEIQQDFTQTLMDTIDKGVGRLVDADMNESSTRLKALQTQEQLAIQALQIANSNAENVMQLFR